MYGNNNVRWQQITYTYPITFSWLFSVVNIYTPADNERSEADIHAMQQNMSLMLINDDININLKLTTYQRIYNRNIAIGI